MTTLVYIGTYSTRGSKGIYTYRMDTASGALSPVSGITPAPVTSPSFVAITPGGRFLYAACEGASPGFPSGCVAAFSLDPTTGLPTLLNEQLCQGRGPCFVSLDRDARHVLVANYGSGSVAVVPIAPDGKLLPPTATIQHHGASGVVANRQEGPHAHSINVDSGNRFAVVTDLGLDQIFVYRYGAAKGTLTPNDPPGIATHPGAGPRHFAFHPNGRLGFAVNELNSTLVSYRYDGAHGVLQEVQSISTLPEGFTGKNYPAEVRVHPSGRFVYGSNRGHDSIAAFAVDPGSGQLKPIGQFPTLGKNPRNFVIDPSGAFLIAANQDTDNVVVFRIDPQTGRLAPAGQTADIPSPVCVRFVPAA